MQPVDDKIQPVNNYQVQKIKMMQKKLLSAFL